MSSRSKSKCSGDECKRGNMAGIDEISEILLDADWAI